MHKYSRGNCFKELVERRAHLTSIKRIGYYGFMELITELRTTVYQRGDYFMLEYGCNGIETRMFYIRYKKKRSDYRFLKEVESLRKIFSIID